MAMKVFKKYFNRKICFAQDKNDKNKLKKNLDLKNVCLGHISSCPRVFHSI